MSNLLDKYNQRFVSSLTEETKEKMPENKDKLFFYRKALEEGSEMEVLFDFCDSDGNVSLMDDNGVTVWLSVDEIKKTDPTFEAKNAARLIGPSLTVKILSIDVNTSTVYVSRATRNNNIRGAIMSEICKELKRENHPVLSGRVLFVNEHRVIVDILNKGILGIIDAKNWRSTYVRFLPKLVKKGDVVTFAVIGLEKRKKGKDISFTCSRKAISPDPWESLDGISENSVITVECVDKPKDKSYFWGVAARVPEIDIMCDYNAKLSIMVSAHYKCRVRTFSKEERKLQVVPFELLPVGVGTVENINFLTKKKKKKEV